MSNYAEGLGMNSEAAENVAIIYAGQSKAMERSELNVGEYVPWVASSWAIAAIYQLIIEPKESKESFYNAAVYYRKLNNPIWRLFQICSNTYLVEETESKNWWKSFQNTEEKFYAYLQDIWLDRDTNFELKTEVFSGRIPELNIPYELVQQTLIELDYSFVEQQIVHFTFLNQLMSRLSENLQLQRNDNNYWYNIQGQIIPFEPAAIAIAVVIVKKWNSQNPLSVLLKHSKLSYSQSLLLRIADDLIGNTSKE